MMNNKSTPFITKYGGITIQNKSEIVRIIFNDKDGISLLTEDGSIVSLTEETKKETNSKIEGLIALLKKLLS